MLDADVIIVGAGLTGLRAALDLRKAGLTVLVVEKRDHVGGRIATSIEEGCKLDHGFQVILRAYPELTLISGVDSLGLKPFRSGARIRWQSRFYDLVDPREQPSNLLTLINHPFASLRDLVRLACLATFYRDTEVRSDVRNTSELLDRQRFSPAFRKAFLEPFLRGILLDPTLSMDSAMTRFYLKVFSEGPACLPRDGMQALPELLVRNLGSSHVRLSSSASRVTEREVILADGETLRAQQVLCALDCLGAAQLGGPEQTLPMHAVGVLYYYTSEEPPYAEPLLVLNGEGTGPINSLAVLTNIQSAYAPPGTSLI
jgi:protoporphyrinogen oxidase